MWKRLRPRGQFIAGLLALVVLASTTLAGCGEDERAVKIVAPAQGSDVTAGDINVSVDVMKFDVVDKIGQAPKDGEGHIHYYLDAGEIPTRDGQPAVTNDQRTYHAQATKDYTWPNVSVGEHTFAVQLVNNDHTPLRPPVIAQVTVRVRAPGGATLPPRSPTASPAGSPGETTSATESPTSTPGGGGTTTSAPTVAVPTPTTTVAIQTATPTP